ncbi:hypothetical protein CDL12_11002 [Handroanthus impetiginosus]|uniref:Uncharacterized protein n=1 Tax=Handroanthus impetiginosus TaxID=429701 RepID=A0A2G9HGD4_9LAMI|nr:hypothetical protein CDL12_11002 [Handroanthus impetiginosus]
MGSKGIVIFGILLATILLISSEVAARELAETLNTINTSKEDKKTNGVALNPSRPFCRRNPYGSCIRHDLKPYTKRRCDYKNLCGMLKF